MPDGHPGDDFLYPVSDEPHHQLGIVHATLPIEINTQLKLIMVLILVS